MVSRCGEGGLRLDVRGWGGQVEGSAGRVGGLEGRVHG